MTFQDFVFASFKIQQNRSFQAPVTLRRPLGSAEPSIPSGNLQAAILRTMAGNALSCQANLWFVEDCQAANFDILSTFTPLTIYDKKINNVYLDLGLYTS